MRTLSLSLLLLCVLAAQSIFAQPQTLDTIPSTAPIRSEANTLPHGAEVSEAAASSEIVVARGTLSDGEGSSSSFSSDPTPALQVAPPQSLDKAKLPIINAALYSGTDVSTPCGVSVASDITSQLNQAIAANRNAGYFYIGPGQYEVTTPICIPMAGRVEIGLDRNARILFKSAVPGTYAIDTYLTRHNAGEYVQIHGGVLRGTGAPGVGGIRINPSSSGNGEIYGMDIAGFTRGDGILLQGAIGYNIHNNRIVANKYGIRTIGAYCQVVSPYSCGVHVTGRASEYAPNANHITHNTIGANLLWGLFEDPLVPSANPLNNDYSANDWELNAAKAAGGDGIHGGGVWLCNSYDSRVIAGYFEGSPHDITMCGTHNVTKASLNANYFTGRGGPIYVIELRGAINTSIQDNSMFTPPSGASSCFINVTSPGNINAIEENNQITTKDRWCQSGSASTAMSTNTSIDNGSAYFGGHVLINTPSDCGQVLCVAGTIYTTQTPTSSSTASNYSVPIILNGKKYYIRLSSKP